VAVGIDAEEATRGADVDGVAARFFAPAERETLLRLPEGARRYRFFELWTLKESLLKALGLGLSHPLEDLAFTISPAGAIGLESATVDAAAWSFALHRVGNYCLSVAVAHTAGAPPLAVRLSETQLPLPRSVGLGGT
jgi:4'-phosphopantetheinyl transferase